MNDLKDLYPNLDEEWQAGYEEWKKKLLESLELQDPPGVTKKQGSLPTPFCYVHRPVKYEGFTDSYEFCEICDAKLRNGQWQRK